MNEHNENLCKGLNLMFIGRVLGLILAVLAMLLSGAPAIVAVVLVAGLAAQILNLMGLFRLRTEHSGYANALILLAVSVLLGIVEKLLQDGSTFQTVLTVAQSVVGMLGTYLVIQATNSFLEKRGLSELAADGKKAWRVTLLGTIAFVVSTALTAGLLVNDSAFAVAGAVLLVVVSLLPAAADLLFLYYLRECSKAL